MISDQQLQDFCHASKELGRPMAADIGAELLFARQTMRSAYSHLCQFGTSKALDLLETAVGMSARKPGAEP